MALDPASASAIAQAAPSIFDTMYGPDGFYTKFVDSIFGLSRKREREMMANYQRGQIAPWLLPKEQQKDNTWLWLLGGMGLLLIVVLGLSFRKK